MEIVARYYFTPRKGLSNLKVARELMTESSIGTWTEVKTLSKSIQKRLSPRVVKFSKKNNTVDIGYPIDLFELGSIPQLLSSLGGNIFGMKDVTNLRLIDIKFPKEYVKSFKGPKYGIEGIRKFVGTKKSRRPHVGTIVKPKIGLNAKEWANVAYNSFKGGLDLVKDDENLTSMKFCKFEDRVRHTLDKVDQIKSEENRNVIYAANITGTTETMLKRADFVRDHGGNCIMMDILTAGWAGVQTVRDQNYKMFIHAHRAMHAALTRKTNHGISMYFLAKLSRLAGVDQLHIGTVVGKMHGSKQDVASIRNVIEYQHTQPRGYLEQDWYGMKPVFAVSSGGVYPRLVPKIFKILGNDVVIQAGGGVHGHPDGTTAGAKAMRQSLDAAVQGISLKKYSKDHEELQKALKKW